MRWPRKKIMIVAMDKLRPCAQHFPDRTLEDMRTFKKGASTIFGGLWALCEIAGLVELLAYCVFFLIAILHLGSSTSLWGVNGVHLLCDGILNAMTKYL